ncbi:helix-turn-helix domain-containing protein [Tepidibacillus decaturensis]|uniref:HTH cro/C1-type domain-containing protein n=1 Tax=Tepidibacillus decaturensis TaxID=1413211 RepID=A0A135L0X1_9BACI|nr:helix-turn-helix domain-containing protein [Tepidibacillus decaturensis]KXG42648.1 hypothetical protein U473_00250 [Tepidibacillus decaturensis]
MDLSKIGGNIKKARKNKKLTQQELADKIGKTESSIRKYEKGLVQVPTDVLQQIADVLDVKLSELMGWDEFDKRFNSNEEVSKEVKLIENVKSCFGEQAKNLLEDFTSLNEVGQSKALDYVSDLVEQEKYRKPNE